MKTKKIYFFDIFCWLKKSFEINQHPLLFFYLNDNESDKKVFDEQIKVSFETITSEDSRF